MNRQFSRWVCNRYRGWVLVLVVLAIATITLVGVRHQGLQALSSTESAQIESLARGTGSIKVWHAYEAERRRGLTRAGAERVRDAAKGAPPPYGLIGSE